MKRFTWRKRLVSLALTAVLAIGLLPAQAMASLLDNGRDNNAALLAQLEELWGDSATAQEVLDLLEQYGLVDEDGNILTDWSDKIYIREGRSLTFSQAMALSDGEVTINGAGTPCNARALGSALAQLVRLGLLNGDTLTTDWQLRVDGQAAAPAQLAAALEAARTPAETPDVSDETPADEAPAETPDVSGETSAGELPAETPDISDETPAGEAPAEGTDSASGGDGTDGAAPAPLKGKAEPALLTARLVAADQTSGTVTVLGSPADGDALVELVDFLAGYDLLTATGTIGDWRLVLLDQEVKISQEELEARLADGTLDTGSTVIVDGTEMTVGDLQRIMEIERIIREYFPTGDVELTREQAENLLSLYQQILANGGLTLYNTQDASDLDFPSGVDQTVTVSAKVEAAGNDQYVVTVTRNGDAGDNQTITFQYRVFDGSVKATADGDGAGQIAPDQSSASFTVTANGAAGQLGEDGQGVLIVQIYDVKNALFVNSDGTRQDSWTQAVQVEGTDTFRYTASWSSTTAGSDAEVVKFDGQNNANSFMAGNLAAFQKLFTVDSYSGNEAFYRWTGLDYLEQRVEMWGVPITFTGLSPGEYRISFSMIGGNSTDAFTFTRPSDGFWEDVNFTNSDVIKVNATSNNDFYISFSGNDSETATGILGDINLYSNSTVARDMRNDAVFFDTSITGANQSVDASLSFQMNPVGYCSPTNALYFAFLPQVTAKQYGVTAREMTSAVTAAISTPDGTFKAGQMVPITVNFGFPVNVADKQLTITVNGEILSPVESEGELFAVYSTHATYLYSVPETGNRFLTLEAVSFADDWQESGSIHPVEGANDLPITVSLPESVTHSANNINTDTTLDIPQLRDALGNWSATVEDFEYQAAEGTEGEEGYIPESTTARVTLTMALPENTEANQTLRDRLLDLPVAIGSGTYSGRAAGSIDGGKTLIPLRVNDAANTLTAEFDITAETVRDLENLKLVMELFAINQDDSGGTSAVTIPVSAGLDQLIYGQYASYSVTKPTPLTADRIAVTASESWPDRDTAQGEDGIWTGSVYVNEPPEGLGLSAAITGSGYTWDDVRWSSSDEDIATISQDGQIHLFGAGTVDFYAIAHNGGVYVDSEDTPEGQWQYKKKVATLTVQEGSTPYLNVPESAITIRVGENVAFRWASNLVQKNAQLGPEGGKATTFTIKVYAGTGNTKALLDGYSYEVTYDPADTGTVIPDGTNAPAWTITDAGATPNQSFTIKGLTRTDIQYTIEITGSAADGVPGAANPYTASATVSVVAQPVKVSLDPPESYYWVNRGQLTLYYTLTNFDYEKYTSGSPEGMGFELVVTDNATGDPIKTVAVPEDAGGGSVTIDLGAAAIPDGFRAIYDVSLQAKNVAEKDWSRDSYTLYIYEQDCLDILVDPVSKNGQDVVTVNGNQITMSNAQWIGSLTQSQILDLNRQIDLQTEISINYDAHPWGEASDRVVWSATNSENAEDPASAGINYLQGAYYENVDNLPYASYAPATDFVLSGRNDGTTVVEAVHALARDLGTSVEVTVETLKDKLYLFQFYPAMDLTMSYVNGDGEAKTITSDLDRKGSFAIYEESGIASDVYVEGTSGLERYLCTVYHEDLVSQEKDAVSLELYPLNTYTLRKAGELPVYLKDEKGNPYHGSVAVRVGVYRNGEWCEDAFADQAHGNVYSDGKTSDYLVTFTNGAHTFRFDPDQFKTDAQTTDITAADDIQFVLELRPQAAGKDDDGYYPVLFSAYGSMNEEDAVRLAQRVVTLEKVPEGQKNKPFIARQALYFTGKERGVSVDVRNKSGRTGPSSAYPKVLLSTTVFWWGETSGGLDANDGRTLRYVDETGTELMGQATIGQEQYPFCSMPVSHNTVPLTEEQLEHLNIGSLSGRNLTLQYIDASGKTLREQTMPWMFINALALDDVTQSDDLLSRIKSLSTMLKETTSDGVSVGGDFLTLGIALATQMNISVPGITMTLAPTKDPTTFRGLISVGLNNIENDNVSGIDADGDRGSDLDFMPGLETIKNVKSKGVGQTFSDSTKAVDYARRLLEENVRNRNTGRSATLGDRRTYYALQGWMEVEVTFDFEDQEWDFTVLTGGLNAGGGMGYEWTWNFQAGPVPLVFQLEAGAAGVLRFTGLSNPDAGGHDFLTRLRLNAYLQAFGGFGFDYAVVALKLGMYGRIGLTAELLWLTHQGNNLKNADGQSVDVDGEVGAKFQVELLFISYEKIIWSQPIEIYEGHFGEYDEITNYWDQALTGAGSSDTYFTPDSGAAQANLLMVDDNGVGLYAADLEPALLDRNYLTQYPRTYDSSGPAAAQAETPPANGGLFQSIANLFSGGDSADDSVVQTLGNSYPQATPVLTDDGAHIFFLHDQKNSSDATDVRVAVMDRNAQGGYDAADLTILPNPEGEGSGYGDSGISVSGSGSDIAVAWSRVMSKPAVTEPGQAVTQDIQAQMINDSDILVAVPDGDDWKVTNLNATTAETESGESVTTSNGVGDLSPVVARVGQNILVAWRQVASSNTQNSADFNARDYIYYVYSENGGETWSEAQPIYNGTSGTVKGIEAAMLPDGTGAVAFTLEEEGQDLANHQYNQHVAYTIIGRDTTTGGSAYDVLRYVVMKDDDLAENPQLAAVKLPDGQEIFLLGWYSTTATTTNSTTSTAGDIRLAAIDGGGNRVTGFADSLSSLIENSGLAVSSDFQFVKNADSLNDLSILWSDTVSTVTPDGAERSNASNVESHGVINGLRFRTTAGNQVSVTAAQRLVEMGDWTSVDNFTAYVNNGDIYTAVQGTFYDPDNTESISVTYDSASGMNVLPSPTDGAKTPGSVIASVKIPQEKTSIFTAAGTYTDTLVVDSVIPDYANIRKGSEVPVQISVTNLGTAPVTSLTVNLGSGAGTPFTAGQDGFTAIEPGAVRTLTVFYPVPANGPIPDPEYSVSYTFGETNVTGTTEPETLVLNVPDVGIADADILVAEEDGKRVLRFTLFNSSDSKLSETSNRVVKLGVYSDPNGENPIDTQYFDEITTYAGGSDGVLCEVSGDELSQIDQGSFTVQYSFDLKSYIQQNTGTDENPEYAFQNDGEVRDEGINLYFKVWVEKVSGTGGIQLFANNADPEEPDGEIQEYVDSNNYTTVKLTGLLTDENKPVDIVSEISSDSTGTQVLVTLKNKSIKETQNGNLIVTLYDAQGNKLAAKQSYDSGMAGLGEDGLVPLGIEGTADFTFQFPGILNAARAEVTYNSVILSDDRTTPTQLSFQGIPVNLDNFERQGEQNLYTASVEVSGISSTVVNALVANPSASITVNGQEMELGGTPVALRHGENVITVTITNGGNTASYVLTVQNNAPSSGGSSTYPVRVAETEHGGVTISPSPARRGQTVTITATPDEGYQVGRVTVTQTSGAAVAVTKREDGVYTFTMPAGSVTVDVTFVPEGALVNPFTDVADSAYYYDAVLWAVENGITGGTTPATFSPDASCTRAQMVTFLWRAAGSPKPESAVNPFTDVSPSAYYYNAVLWAVEQGITNGTTPTTFSPDATVTRGQSVTFLWRSAGSPAASASGFTDVPAGAYYAGAVAWAVERGITNGTTPTTFSPAANCTRAQIVTFLYRYMA